MPKMSNLTNSLTILNSKIGARYQTYINIHHKIIMEAQNAVKIIFLSKNNKHEKKLSFHMFQYWPFRATNCNVDIPRLSNFIRMGKRVISANSMAAILLLESTNGHTML